MITIDDVKDKLLTIEQVQEKLSTTEPLSTTLLSSDDTIHIKYDPEWALTLDDIPGTDPVNAVIDVNHNEYQLTKDAALSLSSAFGIQAAYAKKVPSKLLESHMNYWLGAGMDSREFNMLAIGADQHVGAFAKPTINPFSNQLLLDNAIEGIKKHYGDATLYADYKFEHSLLQTNIRIIVPEYTRTITHTDVEDDLWSAGIHLGNSLSGASQTALEGYLFRFWCTNGATTLNTDAGKWNRKLQGQTDGVYDWAQKTVDEIFAGMDDQFNAVQSLATLDVTGNVVDILHEIFDEYNVPVSQRQGVIDNLLEQPNLTMYSVMQAITQLANETGMEARRADRLMRIGGAIPSTHFNPLKAKVWAEGHVAEPDKVNPYEIVPVI